MPRTSRKSRAHRTRSTGPSPVPPGYPTVIPYLSVVGGSAALDFYAKAFGAKILARQLTPDGKLIHGRLRIGTSIVMVSDVFPGSDLAAPSASGTTTVSLHVYSRNVDALWDRAVAAGAIVVRPLDNQFWGERYGQLRDPFGHRWSVSMRIRMRRLEKAAKRKEAMASFAQGVHPDRDPPDGDA
jgi:PhnB protein